MQLLWDILSRYGWVIGTNLSNQIRHYVSQTCSGLQLNPLTPNDPYSGRTAPLTSKRCISYIYSTNIGTEYFKKAIYSLFFSSKCSLFHNSNIFGSCIIHILYTGVLKLKINNSEAKRLKALYEYKRVRLRMLYTLPHTQPTYEYHSVQLRPTWPLQWLPLT
jgi:hypothetical protein